MNPITIREFASSYQKSRILLSGVELDLFTNIEDSGTTANQIGSKLKLNEHATERLLNSLTSFGFLTKSNNKFFNTQESFSFLSKKSPDYLGGLMHSNHLWNTWSHLTEVVRTGKAAHSTEINERGNEWLFPFISAMHDRAKKQAPLQLEGIDLSGVSTMLDIGGGSGAYSMEFIKRKPEMTASIFDLPNVIPITREFIKKEGFSDNINTCTGDYTKDDLPSGFDLTFLSAVIHSNSFDVNQALIKKCYSSLNINGRIIIQDWIMNNDRTEPLQGAVFAINMLVGTEDGDCYTEQEVTNMLINAGFRNIEKRSLDRGSGQMIAQKT